MATLRAPRRPVGRESVGAIVSRAVSTADVRPAGTLTQPRSYGVYRHSPNCRATATHRYGNYPVRMLELVHEFGRCTLEHLFLDRDDAKTLAGILNGAE